MSPVVVSGPRCASTRTSDLHSWQITEEGGSATRPVAQKVSGSQLLALRLGFLCVWPPPACPQFFSVLPVFFSGETRRLRPTSSAYTWWHGLSAGSSELVSAYLYGYLLIKDATTHGESPGSHSGPWGKLQLATAQARFVSGTLDANKEKLRRGSPAKQPWAWHMCEGNSDLPAYTILASHTCVESSHF